MSQPVNETSDAYTVVVFRGSSSKPLRFSFPRKFIRKLLILVAMFVVADLLVVSHYVIRTGEVWQLSAFRAEAMSAREQTAAFSSAIDDLKRRISAMNEVNQRLRVMLGIEPAKQPGDLANGRGGEEVPMTDSKGGTATAPAGAGLETRQASSESNDVARFVLGKRTWAVLALTSHIEIFTQVHYKKSIEPNADLSPLWKDVFFRHWQEESQHAVLDELEWRREDAKLTAAERDAAVDDLIALVGAVDGILQAQAQADAQYFMLAGERQYSSEQRQAIEASVLKAYRWQYIVSGVQEGRFVGLLASLVTQQQLERISAALAPLM